MPIMDKKNNPKGYIVVGQGKRVLLFYSPQNKQTSKLLIDTSSDGYNFRRTKFSFSITDDKNQKINLNRCSDFHISKLDKNYVLTFRLTGQSDHSFCLAVSDKFFNFKQIAGLNEMNSSSMVVPKFTYKGKNILYCGGDSISLSESVDLQKWTQPKSILLNLAKGENQSISIAHLSVTNEGILLIYALQNKQNRFSQYSFSTLLIDRKNPQNLLWKSDGPIWSLPENWVIKNATLLSIVVLNGKLIAYFDVPEEGLFAAELPAVKQLLDWKANVSYLFLKRVSENPILKPVAGHFWESKAVFNTAAIYEYGKVHLVYRAIGDNDTSVLGYASSTDGIHIDERLDDPIYVHRFSQEKTLSFSSNHLSPYASGGGGYGGCEDPRITKIGDKMYMTYVFYDGANPPRVALTSIGYDDFLKHSWNWEKPVLISPPGVIDKNACILPEKINGKFVIFHRIFPNILIDYVSDLNFDGKSRWLPGEFAIKPRNNYWDSRKIGVGATPIKTNDGWLLIYHAVGDSDASRYKIGAMLLDLNDPTQVLYRSNKPILEPIESYENEGFKSGVVYPCGAVCIKDQLVVYYGGADMVVCAAQANKNEFIHQLKNTGMAHLAPITRDMILN